jgi:hypothetical protein
VDRPAGTTERYTYVGNTQQIETISDGNDEPLLRIDYDDRGRVVKERDSQGLIDGQAVDYEYENLVDGSVRTTVTYPESRLDPSWRPIQSAVHDAKGNLRELVLQPARTERFVGRYDYDETNRRIVLEDACNPAPQPIDLLPLTPTAVLAAALTLLAQLVRTIVSLF